MARFVSPLLVVMVALLLAGAATAAGVEQIEIQPQELPYQVGIYPLVSGRYTLLVLDRPDNAYLLIDDRTGTERTISPPAGPACGLWGNVFAAPWLLFYCVPGAGPTLYNIHTRLWTALPCGQACKDTGLAAPDAIGSDWVEVNENAYCDPRYSACDVPDALVALPSGKLGTYTSTPTSLLDLDSPPLSQTICAPWSRPPSGQISLDGHVVVFSELTGVGVARCGSTSILPLVAGANVHLVETSHLVASCPASIGLGGLSATGPDDVFVPSLRRIWRAELPTGPLPTYPSCPRTGTALLHSTNPEAHRQLVPNGSNQVLLCRYGPSARSRLLAHRVIASPTTVATLVHVLDGLASTRPTQKCSATGGQAITAFFRYPSADDVPVTIRFAGCSTITNGHLARSPSARSDRALVRRIEQLA